MPDKTQFSSKFSHILYKLLYFTTILLFVRFKNFPLFFYFIFYFLKILFRKNMKNHTKSCEFSSKTGSRLGNYFFHLGLEKRKSRLNSCVLINVWRRKKRKFPILYIERDGKTSEHFFMLLSFHVSY